MTIHTQKQQALIDLLMWAHADEYRGTDDDMSDAFDDWMGDLTEKNLSEIIISTHKSL